MVDLVLVHSSSRLAIPRRMYEAWTCGFGRTLEKQALVASAIDGSRTACITDITLVNPRGLRSLDAPGGVANELATVIAEDAIKETVPPCLSKGLL